MPFLGFSFRNKAQKPSSVASTSAPDACHSFKQATSWYSEKDWKGGNRWICNGCIRLENTILKERSKTVQFHNSFSELLECASGDDGCRTCRVFRRALILRQPSVVEEKTLFAKDDKRPIYATTIEGDEIQEMERRSHVILDRATSRNGERNQGKTSRGIVTDLYIKISVQKSSKFAETAYIACTKSSTATYPTVQFDSCKETHNAVRNWLKECEHKHVCRELSWSTVNPTRLLHILDESTIRIEHVSMGSRLQRYVALSYCWGTGVATPEEKKTIKAGETNSGNMALRCQPFNTASLPATIRDAIAFTKRCGIDYIWVDSLCIDQGSAEDWEHEAPLMHAVYGNAVFTLCVSMNNKATERVFRNREAWRTQPVGYQLGRYYVVNVDEDLEEMIKESPQAQRGWTLQEDLLSPRKVYWFGQRAYWVCGEESRIEGIEEDARRPAPFRSRHRIQNVESSASAKGSGFLLACYRGSPEKRFDQWISVVESYSRRNLSEPKDRHKAILSVAHRYLYFQPRDRYLGRDRYLAGLFYHRFAEQLVWGVSQAVKQTSREWKELQENFASWSWLALPFATPVDIRKGAPAVDFEFVYKKLPSEPSDKDLYVDRIMAESGKKRNIQIYGRLRLFMSDSSEGLPWGRVATSSTLRERNLYDISDFHGTNIHFANPDTGRIFAIERRRASSEGQLDYVEDAQRLDSREIQEVYCIEICESAMLLLERIGSRGEVNLYRRLGVCFEYSGDFFTEAERTVILIG